MIREILKYPDPRLKQISNEVSDFDGKLHQLLDDMAETMYKANGVGLAAPQVGVLKRIFVIDIGPSEPDLAKLHEFINPIIDTGTGKIAYEEGCLSVPGITEEVIRKEKITLHYQDRYGKPHSVETEGLLAVAIQHENDHLDGIVFVERLSPFKRRMIKKKFERAVTL